MEGNKKNCLTSKTKLNAKTGAEYENERRLTIAQNEKRMKEQGLKRLADSLKTTKKSNNKQLYSNNKDAEYIPDESAVDDDDRTDREDAETRAKVTRKKQKANFIAPNTMYNTRTANLIKKRVSVTPHLSNALSSKSQTKKGQVSDTSVSKSKVQDCAERHKKTGHQVDTINGAQTISNKRVTDAEKNEEQNSDENFDSEDENVGHDKDTVSTKDVRADEDVLTNEDVRDDEMDVHNDDYQLHDEYDHDIDGSHIYEEPEDQQRAEVESVEKPKRVRGPTVMRKIWKQKAWVRIPIDVNEHGQPINKNTSKLSHFMGELTRSSQYCPVYTPWNKVDSENKKALLNLLRTKFDIPLAADHWILKSFGHKLKNWRARLKECYFDPSLSKEDQLNPTPKEVSKQDWRRLLRYWTKKKVMALSETNKANRAKKKLIQLTGKKSYARIREELKTTLGEEPTRVAMFRKCFSKEGTAKNGEAATAIEKMEKLSEKLPEGETDTPGPNDVFSKVMGNDKYGTAETYGLGVRASDVWGVLPGRSAICQENAQLKAEKAEHLDEIAKLKSQLANKNGSNDGSGVQSLTTSPVVPTVAQRLKIGEEVFLKSIITSEMVAKGWLRSLDPTKVIGGTQIGPNWGEVCVQVAIKKDEKLLRPFGFCDMIGDATGVSIAWPCTFISAVRED